MYEASGMHPSDVPDAEELDIADCIQPVQVGDDIRSDQLQLGDTVRLVPQYGIPSRFSDCTVKQIKDGWITMFRPYVATEHFSYTGGVICYTGIEEYQVHVTSACVWTLLDRQTLK